LLILYELFSLKNVLLGEANLRKKLQHTFFDFFACADFRVSSCVVLCAFCRGSNIISTQDCALRPHFFSAVPVGIQVGSMMRGMKNAEFVRRRSDAPNSKPGNRRKNTASSRAKRTGAYLFEKAGAFYIARRFSQEVIKLCETIFYVNNNIEKHM
jgi:hypothetical protein